MPPTAYLGEITADIDIIAMEETSNCALKKIVFHIVYHYTT